MKTYQGFCNVITKQLFNIIDQKGSLLKWHQEWDGEGSKQLPYGISGIYYGANLFLLLAAQWRSGFRSNYWVTFNQVKKQAGMVKKGAKSRNVFFWQLKKVTENNQDDDTAITKTIPLIKSYHVFNLEQTTLDPASIEIQTPQITSIEETLNKLGVTISHFGGRAYYCPASDTIVLPQPQQFTSKENYYATLFHELLHWTSKNDRFPRKCAEKYSHTQARAEEELIAEIGSVLLASYYNINGVLENHAAYIQFWKQELNVRQIASAINKAAKAFEWIINAVNKNS